MRFANDSSPIRIDSVPTLFKLSPCQNDSHRIEVTLSKFSKLRKRAGITIAEAAQRSGYTERTVYRWESGESEPRKAVFDLFQNFEPAPPASKGSFTFVDLFAGIGGLRMGFEPLGGQCVFTSEWNTYCQKTYLQNFRCDHEIAGDIREVAGKDIPDHDLLLAGFPCQPFSIAGVSKKNALGRPHGFRCDAQGTLFFDVARIIEAKRPRVFVLENVKNLVNHDLGRTFRVIQDTLANELGYQIHVRILDARWFVPQHRERIFIVGFREKTDFDFNRLSLPHFSQAPKLSSILHPQDGSEPPEAHYTVGPNAAVSSKYTLSEHLWTYLQNYAAKHRDAGNGFGYSLVGPDDVARTLSARYFKDGSEILVRQSGKAPRRLTPRECARLMGFDRPGDPFKIPVSDTQAYKQFGNAVVVPVVRAVAEHLRPWLLQDRMERQVA
jgi:DNA (cytosine-5)-methyltransferase 1